MRRQLLITDLDNTLYDWVTYFSKSFSAMVDALVEILEVDRSRLLSEFKAVHQRYGNTEQPFAVLQLPSVQARFPGLSNHELADQLDAALHAFNSTRKRTLKLYAGVEDTLRNLQSKGIILVGHTEAMQLNSYYRLNSLGIAGFFEHLYALEGTIEPHPRPGSSFVAPPQGFVINVPLSERKPNPRLLMDICRNEGIELDRAIYVGDSITRDVSMALAAGVTAAWARYGRSYSQEDWNLVVAVTHWTEVDVRQEEELRQTYGHVTPDVVIDSFDEILPFFD
jgi:FMN phosphatase YigB (HAD superfamily)